jgi:hypothetical protein
MPAAGAGGARAPRRGPPRPAPRGTGPAQGAPADGWQRLAAMKAHLAHLQAQRAAGAELPASGDGKFLDLLVAAANARDPSLRITLQSVDVAALRGDAAAAAEAVSGLAGSLANGVRHGSWHAVLAIDGHHVAVAAVHDPRHPSRVSVAVLDSLGSELTKAEWLALADGLRIHANHALAQAGKAPNAQVWLNCLSPSLLQTSTGSGSDVFALAALRKMPGDAGLILLHRRVLNGQRRTGESVAVRVSDGRDVIGARLFKLMTRPASMEALLDVRPELRQATVNRKGQTLDAYQAAHEARRKPPFGIGSSYNVAFEEKRLRMVERAIAHLAATLAPGLDDMKAHLADLRRAAAGEAGPPAALDEHFLRMLIDSENARDPSLRLAAHRLDAGRLAAGDPAAAEPLSQAIADGMRSGEDWQATLDIAGHHVALSARHDPAHPGHVSLVVMEDAGSPMSRNDWKTLVAQLVDRLPPQPASAGAAGSAKLWVTHLDLSARQPTANSALFALMAAKDMAGDTGIAAVHAEALAQAAGHPAPGALRGRPADEFVDPGYGEAGAEDPMAHVDIAAQQVEMYQDAVHHHEQALGLHGGT